MNGRGKKVSIVLIFLERVILVDEIDYSGAPKPFRVRGIHASWRGSNFCYGGFKAIIFLFTFFCFFFFFENNIAGCCELTKMSNVLGRFIQSSQMD